MKQIAVASKFFVDTNVLLYLVENDEAKATRASKLVDLGAVISVQVLNEFINSSRKKFKLPWDEIKDVLDPIKSACQIEPLTALTHGLAASISELVGIAIYDANIVAAAELAGCDVLYTEDLNDGQRIGRVTIRNPFM